MMLKIAFVAFPRHIWRAFKSGSW